MQLINIVLDKRRFTEEEAAKIINPARPPCRTTLRKWRREGKLGFFRIAGEVVYGEQHIAEFIASCERKPKGKK